MIGNRGNVPMFSLCFLIAQCAYVVFRQTATPITILREMGIGIVTIVTIVVVLFFAVKFSRA